MGHKITLATSQSSRKLFPSDFIVTKQRKLDKPCRDEEEHLHLPLGHLRPGLHLHLPHLPPGHLSGACCCTSNHDGSSSISRTRTDGSDGCYCWWCGHWIRGRPCCYWNDVGWIK